MLFMAALPNCMYSGCISERLTSVMDRLVEAEVTPVGVVLRLSSPPCNNNIYTLYRMILLKTYSLYSAKYDVMRAININLRRSVSHIKVALCIIRIIDLSVDAQ